MLFNNDIALYIRPVISVNLKPHLKRVTWPSQRSYFQRAIDQPTGSVVEYFEWIKNQEYSAFLYDGSFLQISFEFHRDILTRHRLVYYPCPFEMDTADMTLFKESAFIDVLEEYAHRNDRFRTRSAIRFDYSEADSKVGHPASHMTMLTDSCRWAVFGPVSLEQFVGFVFQHFYPEQWHDTEYLRKLSPNTLGRTIAQEEEKSLHVNALLG